MKKRILIADDHYVVRMSTALILENHSKDFIVEHAENYNEVTVKVSQDNYDLLILDIEMPGSLFEYMIKEMKDLNADMKILIFSGHRENVALQYILAGAEGYLNKNSDGTRIIESVTAIFEKGYYYPQELMHDFLVNRDSTKTTALPFDILSEREVEIYKLLIKGDGVLEISNHLNLHMSTISTHKKRIFQKLKINTIADLIHLHNRYFPS
ncbi:response regulator transcription factor [Epilithonimonas sp.]|uniref:response regulator transcription factor n=1 Tax=Epilithonimonas sp. TaxID=2894511 RepID=UPI00289FD172|nr:response regulator transcription factor [Epilithonimonas sp.]